VWSRRKTLRVERKDGQAIGRGTWWKRETYRGNDKSAWEKGWRAHYYQQHRAEEKGLGEVEGESIEWETKRSGSIERIIRPTS